MSYTNLIGNVINYKFDSFNGIVDHNNKTTTFSCVYYRSENDYVDTNKEVIEISIDSDVVREIADEIFMNIFNLVMDKDVNDKKVCIDNIKINEIESKKYRVEFDYHISDIIVQ
jgi:hypothetical protein